MKYAAIAVAAAVLGSAVAAQTPRPAAAALTALVGGTLVDGSAGPPIQNSVILIDGDRISAVGQVGTLAVPALLPADRRPPADAGAQVQAAA